MKNNNKNNNIEIKNSKNQYQKLKCNSHNLKIVLLCCVCLKPLCLDCIVSGDHLNHKIDYFTQLSVLPILIDFKINYSYLYGYNKSNSNILQSSLEFLNKIKPLKEIKKNQIENQIEIIHNKLNQLKNDIIKQLSFNCNNSNNPFKLNININIKELLNQIKTIYNIQSTISNRDEYNGLMMKKLFKFNNKIFYYSNGEPFLPNQYKYLYFDDDNNSKMKIENYNLYGIEEICLSFHQINYDHVLSNIKIIYISGELYKSSINEKLLVDKDIYIFYKDLTLENNYIIVKLFKGINPNNKRIFLFTIDQHNIKFITKQLLNKIETYQMAFGDLGKNEGMILQLFENLDGQISEFHYFHQIYPIKGKRLFFREYTAIVYKISVPLVIGIFSKFIILHFGDGFNQKINIGIIPSSVERLSFGNIGENVLNINSIPESVKGVLLYDGFNQKLLPGIISKTVENVEIRDITTQLIVGSLPNGLKRICFDIGHIPSIKKGIIPKSVQELTVSYERQKLKELDTKMGKPFDQILARFIVPKCVGYLSISYLPKPLGIGSIPYGVQRLAINEYKFSIPKYIIPSSIYELFLGNLEKPLKVGSIPSKIEYLFFMENFNQLIDKPGIIPKRVKKLIINSNFKILGTQLRIIESVNELIIRSPDQKISAGVIKSVKILKLDNQTIKSGVLPEGISKLILKNINSPLEIGSIPNVKTLCFLREFNSNNRRDNCTLQTKFIKGILPEKIKNLYIYSFLDIPLDFLPRDLENLYLLYNINEIVHQHNQIIPDTIQALHIYEYITTYPDEKDKILKKFSINYQYEQLLTPNTTLDYTTIHFRRNTSYDENLF